MTTATGTTTEAAAPRGLLSGVPLALIAAALYMLVMVVVFGVSTHEYADTNLLLQQVWWVLLIGVLATLLLLRASGIRAQRSNAVPWQAAFLVLLTLIAVFGFGIALGHGITDGANMAFVLLATLLVGIGEVTAYRGIALNALAERFTVIWAVVGSAVLFGLLHIVNVMAAPLGTTLIQVVFTGLVGLVYGWTYVFSGGNLWLVIACHWLYDFSLIAAAATTDGKNPVGGIPVLFGLVAAVVLTVLGVRAFKGQRLSGV